jgi:hypothetical protein
MSERTWENIRHGGRERWNYVEWREYGTPFKGRYRHVIGCIIKTKNKRKCKDWLVQYSEVRSANLRSTTLATLKQLSAAEARGVATIILEGACHE